MTRLTDILKPQNVKVPLLATTKADAIRELVDLLDANGELTDADAVFAAAMERDRYRSTSVGYGHAFPFATTEAMKSITSVVGLSPTGINWPAIDDDPVHLVWLIASRPEESTKVIQIKAVRAKTRLSYQWRTEVQSAKDAESLFRAIELGVQTYLPRP